jgi:hypothetical protein
MAHRQILSDFCGIKKYIMETKHTKFPTPPWDMEIAAERRFASQETLPRLT